MPTFNESIEDFFDRPLAEGDRVITTEDNIFDVTTVPSLMDYERNIYTQDDLDRLDLYEENTHIYKGEFVKVWPSLEEMTRISRGSVKTPFEVQVLNDGQPIIDAITNLLFREPPTLNAQITQTQPEIDRLCKTNNFFAELKEAARECSYLGDAVALIWWGTRADESESRIHIQFVHPQFFIGIFDPLNSSVLTIGIVQYLLNPITGTDKSITNYLYRQIHGKGFIVNQLWSVEHNKLIEQVPLATLPQFADRDDFQKTGVDELLITPIKNVKDSNSSWGCSDFTSSLKTKFRARTEIMTQFNMVRAKHSNPKLAVPQSVLHALNKIQSGNSVNLAAIPKEDLSVVGLFPGEDIKYVTWNGQLEAAVEQLSILQKQIWQEAKISPTLLGAASGGLEGGETGRANTIKLIASLGLANTKQQLWAPAIDAIFRKAQKLDNVKRKQNKQSTYDVSSINVVFQDGLPADDLQIATTFSTQVNSGLKSRRTAIREMTGWNDELVQEELNRIMDEENKTDTVSPDTIVKP